VHLGASGQADQIPVLDFLLKEKQWNRSTVWECVNDPVQVVALCARNEDEECVIDPVQVALCARNENEEYVNDPVQVVALCARNEERWGGTVLCVSRSEERWVILTMSFSHI